VKSDVKDKVKQLLHPLKGGPGPRAGRSAARWARPTCTRCGGRGGGRPITDLAIVDEGRRLRVEMLKLSDDELPQLIGVEIQDRG